jgi:AraC-like DNA-binding protein
MLLRDPYTIQFYEFSTPGIEGGLACYEYLTCIPSVCMDVLFITGSLQSRMEFVGAGTQLRHLKTFPGTHYFGVRLIPGMFLSYNGLSLREAANEEFFFNGDNGILKEFLDGLKKTASLEEKIELFYCYFQDNLDNSKVNELTQSIICEINAQCGNLRISQLADDNNYSERHISRIFQESMGLTPKAFARIIRFQYALDCLLTAPQYSPGDYFYDLGYSDQAHFQREFKQYTGTTPRNFYTYVKKEP